MLSCGDHTFLEYLTFCIKMGVLVFLKGVFATLNNFIHTLFRFAEQENEQAMDKFEEPLQLYDQKEEDLYENKSEVSVSSKNSSKTIKMEFDPNTEDSGLEDDNTYFDEEVHRNPLLFPTVLPILFSHMDGKTLKEARLVCQLWKNLIAPIFKKKMLGYVELVSIANQNRNHQEENDKICLKYLNMLEGIENKELPFDHLCINVFDMCSEQGMSQIFKTYGSQIHSLELLFDGCLVTAEQLKQILLNWCTNLKTLHLSNIPLEVAESTEDIFSVGDVISSGPICSITKLVFFDETPFFPLANQMVFHLLSVCPLLSHIDLDVEDGDALSSFMDGMQMTKRVGCLTNLNSLTICCNFDERHLVSLIDMNLHLLTRLEIFKVGTDISSHNLCNLLRQCSNSLETLSLNVDVEVSWKTEFTNKILSIPKMTKLKHLEIKSGKIQLSENINIISQFPNLKTCILEEDCQNCIGCFGYCIHSMYWNTITLKCKQDSKLPFAQNSLVPIQFSYKPYCVKNFQTIRKYFPTLKSVYASICEERSGIVDSFSDVDEVNIAVDRLVFVDLFMALSKTNIEELHIEIGCQVLRGSPCCRDESLEVEKTKFKKLLHRSNMLHANVITAEVERESVEAQNFPELRRLNIVSNGCRKMNMDVLRQLGVLNLVENVAVLSEFAIKYRYKNSSETAVIFSQKQPCDKEFHDTSADCQKSVMM